MAGTQSPVTQDALRAWALRVLWALGLLVLLQALPVFIFFIFAFRKGFHILLLSEGFTDNALQISTHSDSVI